MLQLFQKAKIYAQKAAIVSNGSSYTYQQLLFASQQFATLLLDGASDLKERRIAFLVEPGFDYVKVQWGIWQAGGVAVPLCTSHPLPSLQYVIEDTEASVVAVSPSFREILQSYAETKSIRFIVLEPENDSKPAALPQVEKSRRAMILYTSGTTNLPKGVVTTHANLEAQISTLVTAWGWTSTDHTLCILPLHHVHGIINVVSCALWSGAACEFLPSFSAEKVFSLFAAGQLNVFMAVPTIYYKLIAHFESLEESERQQLTAVMKKFRLMVSGSAALPVSVMEKWEKLSGHRLLERYGMTEIGMAISNPYEGERKAGFIGLPLPGVGIRLADEANIELKDTSMPGEIQVKGENVFKEYWQKPEATMTSFTPDGWFKTGDVAEVENGYYKILGRNSVDIIKSGGYKISALEIEEVLRSHPAVSDCAVVGLPDEEWGEIVAAAIVGDSSLDTEELTPWLKARMPGYRVPRKYLSLPELPRNAMGKVTKNDVKKLFNI
ncbi:MAG: acyl-CoA synthetase [Imperialibacter sp.]|uniref:acyl-CoA synthetase n=1 Tax=Imperialibacter sp. TaxID=2038411 RepID=UPI0032EA9D8E